MLADVDDCQFATYPEEYQVIAVDFSITFDVIVLGLALPAISAKEVYVQLWDVASDVSTLSYFVCMWNNVEATFQVLVVEAAGNDWNNSSRGYWKTNEIHPHLLPKGFVGSLRVYCQNSESGQACIGIRKWFGESFFPAVEISPVRTLKSFLVIITLFALI